MKILDLTTDSLLLSLKESGVEVVHCQTGRAVMHSGCPKEPPRFTLIKLVFELTRARRFDWVILPPVHIDWVTGNGFVRKTIKRVLAWFLRHPNVSRFFKNLVFGANANLVITDYSDQFYPSEFGLTCIAPKHYFMLNVPREIVGAKLGPQKSLIHYLPTIIPDQLIDSLEEKASEERRYDVFVAGNYHNEQRIKQREAARLLAKKEWEVFELGEKSFGKFLDGLLSSKICLAGRGLAYHCFRPLEAAAAGAAPVCHRPEKGTYHDYVHGVNCYLYDANLNPEEIASFLENILLDSKGISKVAQGAKELLNKKHRATVLAENIVNVLRGASC